MSDDRYPLSASQIKTHEWCALQYWFQYLSEYETYTEENEYLKLGNLVHDTIESALPNDFSNVSLDMLERRFEAVMQDQVNRMGLDRSDDDDAEIIEKAQKQLNVAARYIRKRCHKRDQHADDGEDDSPVQITDVEKWIEFAPNRPDLSYPMRAKIDIVSQADGEIWDWKTGSIRDNWIQATLYYAAFTAEYGFEPNKVIFVHLGEREVVIEEPQREDWEKLVAKANEVIEAKENDYFPATGAKDDKCYHCDWEPHCPETDVGVSQFAWEDY